MSLSAEQNQFCDRLQSLIENGSNNLAEFRSNGESTTFSSNLDKNSNFKTVQADFIQPLFLKQVLNNSMLKTAWNHTGVKGRR